MEKIQLNFAHICDSAFLSKDGKINIIGDFDRVFAKKIPDTNKIFHSFFVVTNFSITEPGEYEQLILIKSDDDQTVLNVSTKNKVLTPGKTGFLGNFGIVFPKYGSYKVEVYMVGDLKVQLPLLILDPDANQNVRTS